MLSIFVKEVMNSKMIFSKGNILLIATVVFLFSTLSCRKDRIIDDATAKLSFSTDTLTFDTVFTKVGSTTGYIKAYNNHNETINISYVQLVGGSASQFRINVDGTSGVVVNDITILPKDSMYVFIEVTVDPNNDANPFFLEDEIRFFDQWEQTGDQTHRLGSECTFL